MILLRWDNAPERILTTDAIVNILALKTDSRDLCRVNHHESFVAIARSRTIQQTSEVPLGSVNVIRFRLANIGGLVISPVLPMMTAASSLPSR